MTDTARDERIVAMLLAVRDEIERSVKAPLMSERDLPYRVAGKLADLGYAMRTGKNDLAEREAVALCAFVLCAVLTATGKEPNP